MTAKVSSKVTAKARHPLPHPVGISWTGARLARRTASTARAKAPTTHRAMMWARFACAITIIRKPMVTISTAHDSAFCLTTIKLITPSRMIFGRRYSTKLSRFL